MNRKVFNITVYPNLSRLNRCLKTNISRNPFVNPNIKPKIIPETMYLTNSILFGAISSTEKKIIR